jgi:hypothetical protein
MQSPLSYFHCPSYCEPYKAKRQVRSFSELGTVDVLRSLVAE